VQEPARLKLELQVIAPKLTAGSPSRTTHTIAQIQLMGHKDSYALKENIVVKAERTNLTSKTVCFPVPDQECSTPQTG
jgi:hypothetical protein